MDNPSLPTTQRPGFSSQVCERASVLNRNATARNVENQSPHPDLGQFVTRAQLCAALKIHRATVRRWTKAGKLTAYAFTGLCLRYSLKEVQQLLQESKWSRAKKRGPKPKATHHA